MGHKQINLKVFKSLKILITGDKNTGKTQILYYINTVLNNSIYINGLIFNNLVKSLLFEIHFIKHNLGLFLELNNLFLKNTLLIDNLNEIKSNVFISEVVLFSYRISIISIQTFYVID